MGQTQKRFLLGAITGLLLFVALLVFGTGHAKAAPVIETVGRAELNWSNHKIRFYGEAKADSDEALRVTERRAWSDGLAYAAQVVKELNGDDAKEMAQQVSTSTISVKTSYYADGTVRVLLENALPKALANNGLRFRQKEAMEPGATSHTGVLLVTDQTMKPQATYQVVDEAGAVLFDVHDMAATAFRKNLMGRWFKRPSPEELSEAVGKTPVEVKVRAKAPGVFVVAKADWEQAVGGHGSLLTNGLIAVALP